MAMALIVSCDSKTPEPTPVEPKKNVISIGSENYDSYQTLLRLQKTAIPLKYLKEPIRLIVLLPLTRKSQSKVQVSERLYSTS